eukprot:12626_1
MISIISISYPFLMSIYSSLNPFHYHIHHQTQISFFLPNPIVFILAAFGDALFSCLFIYISCIKSPGVILNMPGVFGVFGLPTPQNRGLAGKLGVNVCTFPLVVFIL